ncbi:TPA: relaxase [Citrobacter freundii]|nr:relaxase [Salmonella enterica subsp. enterica serovar Newport]HCB1641946.1 relaxase [Citrobacter freundii]
MITRYGGGNDGIAEYLENGRKAEREYTRDELDHRLILDGDLQTTNKVIQSIEDKGQERYLHITLSFQESEISAETLNAVTQEYKTLFMNAYHEDEYCFYAEAHLPKIKNLVDNRTGEHVERKPHIHIVIPRTNLVTEKSMNPRGDLTNSKTQEQLDAIQEHINNKYHLVSPKDAVRVSDQNYANVLSRTKGDLFNERNSDVKRAIYARLESENIRSFSDFKTLLTGYGEVKTRNAGKAGEYLSVKLDGDKKFTNLKNPLFSKQYVESRELPLIKPTEKQISARLEAWTSRASHEIKHIYPASSRIREAYKSLDDKGKAHFLAERIKSYDEKNKLNKGHVKQTRGRQGSHERSFDPSSRLDRIKTGIGLPRLPKRGLVYGINGRSAPTESVGVLPDNAERDLAKRLQERQHSDSEMRRDSDRQQQGRGLKTVEESFFVNDLLLNKLNEEAEKNELATMGKIRKEIDPERFLSAVAREFNVNAASHAVSKAPDGSPRFSVGKRNLNASDFLTKHLNLSWSDAKKFLLKTYADQEAKKPFDKPVINRALNRKEAKERLDSLKSGNKTLRDFIKDERRKMYNDLREMRKELRSIPPSDREVAKGVLVYKKLTTLESLAEMEKEGRNIIRQYHANWLEGNENMKAVERLKNYLNREEENGIQADQPETSLVKAVEAQKRLEELRRSNTKLKDLVMDKQDGKIVYRDQETESPVFTDKGDFVVASKEASKEEIAVMLDYSREKFGGVLKLTGTDEFKQQCATIAAEKGMNIILRPEKFQKLMLETKAELDANKIHQDEKEMQQPQPETQENAVTRETEQEATAQPEARQTVEEVKALLADNEMRRMMMNDEQKRREFSASMDNDTKVKAEINAEIIQAKTGVELDPVSLEQDVINAHNATLEPKEATTQPEARQTVEEVKALLADNEMRRMMMNDEQKRREFSASMDNDTKVKAEINAEIIQAKTGVELDPVSLEQDVINAHNATLEPSKEALKAAVEQTPNPATPSQLKTAVEQATAQPEARQTVEEVKALLADNEMRRMMMNDEQKRREFSASMDNDTKVKAEINAEIIQAKTGVELDPVSLEQDVINAHNATLEPKEATTQPEETVYIVKFPKQELNENIRPFNSVREAVAYSKTVSALHSIDADKASVQAVDKATTETKGIQEAAKDAVPVPRHELERAQGRDVSEQDGKILEAIDQYQDKFVSEGLEFNRPEMEAELLNHNLTRDVAEDRMEQKFTEEKSRHNEQERDNGMER